MVANLKLVANSTWFQEAEAVGESGSSVRHLPLASASTAIEADDSTPSYKMLAIVLSVHMVVLAAMLAASADAEVSEQLITPMTVSLVNAPSADEPQITEQPPEVVTVPKKQKTEVKQVRQPVEMPVKVAVTPQPVISEPSALPAVAEAASSENPVKSEQAAQPVEVSAKDKNEAEPVIEPPRFGAAYLNNPAPAYPSLSRRSGEQGRVLLKVLVSEKGLAESVQLNSSSGYEKLDQAAIEAVKKWSFIPAKRSNQPVSAYVLVPVKFSLNS